MYLHDQFVYKAIIEGAPTAGIIALNLQMSCTESPKRPHYANEIFKLFYTIF